MTLDTTPAHIARALLEALGCQLHDIVRAVGEDTGLRIERLHVGGGVSASDVACQLQADVLGLPVVRAAETETSVRAAALLAGMGVGVWKHEDDLPRLAGSTTVFEPQRSADEREAGLAAWRRALERAKGWV